MCIRDRKRGPLPIRRRDWRAERRPPWSLKDRGHHRFALFGAATPFGGNPLYPRGPRPARGTRARIVMPTTDERRRMKHTAAWEDRSEGERALRFGADRICLWVLCADHACRRAKACRGDVRVCGGRMAAWLAAFDEERRVRPDFAEIEWRIETAQELRAYRC